MTRITVADTVLKAGEPWAHTPVRVELCDSDGTPVAPAYVTDTGVLVEPFTTATDADGTFTVQLDPTDAIAPTGCFYGFTVGDVGPIVIRGDQGDGSLRSLRASTPTVLGSTATLDGLADVDITGRVDGSVVEWDTTSSTWIMGTGGGGGGAPSGPAGGVLSGTYPNPGFAADMATQAELDAHTGGTDPHGDRAYAAGLVDDLSGVTNAATARTNLGLGTAATQASSAFDAAGTAASAVSTHAAASDPHGDRAWASSQFQPLDSDLTAIAALSTTSFGRALLELADAAAGRTALGLGSLATLSTITTTEITDGTIVNADISASAAIAATKISGTAVVQARAVNAGTGLTGGGDLSADRTLAVSYGTTAGTAAQGNDSRLSDTRTPTDGTVTDAKVASNAAISLSKLAQPAQAAVVVTAWSLYA